MQPVPLGPYFKIIARRQVVFPIFIGLKRVDRVAQDTFIEVLAGVFVKLEGLGG